MINILDVVVIFLILGGAAVGLKKGAIKSSVSFLGIILVVILSYLLKNPLANFLITHCPFIDFGSFFKGVSVLNILIYEAVSFLIVFSLLQIILKIIIHFTGILENILNATIILGIPSKILGFIFGALEGYVYAFVILFVLSLFSFSIEITQNSNFNAPILNHTPLLSSFAKDSYESITEIYDLKDNYENITNKKEYNYKAMEILLKKKIVTPDTVKILVDQNKIDINNVNSLIEKYEEENND